MAAPGGFQLGGGIKGGGLQLGGTTGGLQTAPQLGGGLNLTAGTSSAAGGFQLGTATQTAGLGGISGGGLQLGNTQLNAGQRLGTAAGGVQLNAGQRLGTVAGGLQLGTSSGGGLQLGTTQQTGGQRLGTSGGGLQLGGGTGVLASTAVQQPLTLGGLKFPGSTAPTASGLGTTGQTGGLQSIGLKTTLPSVQTTATALPTLSTLKPGGLPAPSLTSGLKLPGQMTTAGAPPTLTASTGLTGLKAGQTGLKPTVGTSTVTTAGTTTLSGSSGSKYTYKQLEQLVNKWSLELQEQEKVFLQQASQVNKWDRMLADSGDKIADLSEEVEAVKKEQKSMESELDLIETQQKELDEMLTTMEKDIDQAPNTGGYQADLQRTRIFQMAESVDSQLKRMAQDLKEIIEQMNEANRNQDEDSTFHQIVKILNAHTDSLGWIDRETALLKHKVEDISKITEHRKREQERSFRLAFDQ